MLKWNSMIDAPEDEYVLLLFKGDGRTTQYDVVLAIYSSWQEGNWVNVKGNLVCDSHPDYPIAWARWVEPDINIPPRAGQIWENRHGQRISIVGVGKVVDSDPDEEYVIYRHVPIPGDKIWLRPLVEFGTLWQYVHG